MKGVACGIDVSAVPAAQEPSTQRLGSAARLPCDREADGCGHASQDGHLTGFKFSH